MDCRRFLPLAGAACLVLALGACDRRNTQPPDESRAADTEIQPAGATGEASRPADSTRSGDRCDQLEGEARRSCMAQVDSDRDATDMRP